MKKRMIVGLAVGIASLVTGSASAHVVVKPADALTGAYTNFSVSVPNEKEVPVTGVKLLVPDYMQSVTPTVKPGWTIDVDKVGTGEAAKVKSITWSGGSIPAGLRDDFGFSAKTPDKAADIQWKAYQTYEGGQVISWDQKPGASDDESANSGPYSVTKVAAKSVTTQGDSSDNSHSDHGVSDSQARLMSVIALAVAFVAFVQSGRKKNEPVTVVTSKTKK